jgi:hypothetical protein
MLAWLGLCLALGCKQEEADSIPPLDAFYFPSSIAYVERAGSEEGILLVANANFDKRYKQGSFVAVDLSALGEGGLPAFGQKEGTPKFIRELNIRPEHALKVSSFSGRMGLYSLPGGGTRFFLPSRSEGALLHVIDMDAPTAEGALNVRCFPKPEKDESNCTQTALSLTANEGTNTGLPRAPSPGAAVVSAEGEVWLTHMNAADSPASSLKNRISYAVHLSAAEPRLTDDAFMPIGEFPSDTALPLGNWVLLTGRGGAPALRMLSQTRGEVVNAGIESSLGISEGRDLALSNESVLLGDKKQIFLLGRYPDMLLVLRLNESAEPSSPPSLQVVREIPLPEAPNALHVLKRKEQGDLVAIVSSGSSALSFYDQDAGILTGQLLSLGEGPFSIASSMRGDGNGARLFIGNFSDGRIAVVDIEDLKRPQDARVVALLGKSQTCLVQGDEAACKEGT